VVVVPEGQEDYLYAVVARTIGGVVYRHIERMHSRRITNRKHDAFFVDSGLTYDGRNTGATTMQFTGGTTWDVTEVLTCEASAPYFTAGDVGNEMRLRAGDVEVRFTITGYTDNQHVTGQPLVNVPVGLQAVAVTDWGKAVDALSGLGHLEGKEVAILGDGVVDPPKTVTAAAITLSRCYEVVHVGLGYDCDLETLALENTQTETLSDKKKLINRVSLQLQQSAQFLAGPDADHLRPSARTPGDYANPGLPDFATEEVVLDATWDNNGRVFIRQPDPLPLTVLSIVPSGFVGG
jgi:hypothetical protein